MNAKTIQKYSKYDVKALKRKATTVFNRFIRERDKGRGCISCGNPYFSDAGHYYAAGNYSALRYNEDNVHGQCKQCNYFKHGNLIHYRENLIKKIGIERVEKLDLIAQKNKRYSFKLDRFTLIEIIEKYK